jgi:hypothetical protein
METVERIETVPVEAAIPFLQWTPVVAGAFVATAVSVILIAFWRGDRPFDRVNISNLERCIASSGGRFRSLSAIDGARELRLRRLSDGAPARTLDYFCTYRSG